METHREGVRRRKPGTCHGPQRKLQEAPHAAADSVPEHDPPRFSEEEEPLDAGGMRGQTRGLGDPRTWIQMPASWPPAGGALASRVHHSEPPRSSLQNGRNGAFLTAATVRAKWDDLGWQPFSDESKHSHFPK